MPTCDECGAQFSGDPCNRCGHSKRYAAVFALADKRRDENAAWERWQTRGQRMPSATRRKRKHGRR